MKQFGKLLGFILTAALFFSMSASAETVDVTEQLEERMEAYLEPFTSFFGYAGSEKCTDFKFDSSCRTGMVSMACLKSGIGGKTVSEVKEEVREYLQIYFGSRKVNYQAMEDRGSREYNPSCFWQVYRGKLTFCGFHTDGYTFSSDVIRVLRTDSGAYKVIYEISLVNLDGRKVETTGEAQFTVTMVPVEDRFLITGITRKAAYTL